MGEGGFGIVWKAIDLQNNNSEVAVKELKEQTTPEETLTATKYWFQELQTNFLVSYSPQTPRVPCLLAQHSELGSRPFLVMEFIPGQNAQVHYEENPTEIDSGPKAIKFLLSCLETLDSIHKKGILHRDLKPENIIIHAKTRQPWILDFGIAKPINIAKQGGNTVIGTPQFQAPEVDEGKVKESSDIFGLGRTLLSFLMTYDDTSWEDILPRCCFSNPLKDIILKMTEIQEKKRYQNCTDVIHALCQLPEISIDLMSLTKQHTLKGHEGFVWCVVELGDGTLASGSWDNTIKIWDINTQQCLRTLKGHNDYIYGLVRLADGTIASGSIDSTIKMWDPSSGLCLNTIDNGSAVWCVYQLADGRIVVGGGGNGTIKLWDIKTATISLTLNSHSDTVNCVIQLVDGRLVSGAHDKTIKVWDIKTGSCLNTMMGHQDWVRCMIQLADGTLVSGAEDKTIKFWDTNTYECIRTINIGDCHSLVQLFDGTLVCSGVGIVFVDPKTGSILHTIRTGEVVLTTIQLDDGRLACGTDNNTITMWGN